VTAKLSFRKWLNLETHKKQLMATESSDFPDRVFDYLSVAFGSVDKNEPWENSVFLLLKGFKDFQPDGKLPLLQDAPKEQQKPVSWDYDGRTWAYWSHLLAKSYGWTLEYIGKLDVNEALARVQEILTDEQLEHEFVYGLSEIAYPYNKSTKTQNFKPMPRPYWMKAVTPPVKTMKFRRDMLPMGIVQDISGMPSEYNPLRDYVQPKEKEETNTSPSP
jgi:hypothetical protein